MKIQPLAFETQDQLVDLLINYLDALPGHLRLLEKELQTDYGSVALALDQGGRLVVLLASLEQDDSALVRVLATRGWLKRHRHLFERLFQKKGSELSSEIRLLLIAPGFSREMEDAVKGTQLDVELYRFRALNVDRQVALLLDPVFHSEPRPRVSPKTKKLPGIRNTPRGPSPGTGGVTLSDEEKRYFSVVDSSN